MKESTKNINFVCAIAIVLVLAYAGIDYLQKQKEQEEIKQNEPIKGEIVEIKKIFRLFSKSDNTIVKYEGELYEFQGTLGELGELIEFKRKDAITTKP